MLKRIISSIGKKQVCCVFLFFLSSCISNPDNNAEKLELVKQELANILSSHNRGDVSKVHLLTKQLMHSKSWDSAFLGYQWLCQNAKELHSHYCRLMWSSANQNQNQNILFEAAATNYSLKKTPYWLEKSQLYAKSNIQKIILKTLQNTKLSNQEIVELSDYPQHYAQALFLKGKSENSVVILQQAKNFFSQFENWEKVGDILLLSAKLSFTIDKKSQASRYFNEAILYYDLANASNKLEFAIHWGKSHGITW